MGRNKVGRKLAMLCVVVLLSTSFPSIFSSTVDASAPDPTSIIVVGVNGDIIAYSFLSDVPTQNISGIMWSFGDGVGSSVASPVHQYDRVGRYNVNLIIKGIDGSTSKASYIVNVGDVLDTPENPPPQPAAPLMNVLQHIILVAVLVGATILIYERKRRRVWGGDLTNISLMVGTIATIVAVLNLLYLVNGV